MSLEYGNENDDGPSDAADLLAEKTGCERAEFVPDGVDIPDFDEQEIVTTSESEE